MDDEKVSHANKFSYNELLNKIVRYCAYQERSLYQVRLKLNLLGASPETSAKIFSYLEQHNFVNEDRFTEMFVKGKLRQNKWGRIKILAHLKSMRIDEACIKKHLSLIDDEEYAAIATDVVEKKIKELRNVKDLRQKKYKVLQFAASKGFESALIMEISDKLI